MSTRHAIQGLLATLVLASSIALGATAAIAADEPAQELPASSDDLTMMEVDASRFPIVRVGFGVDGTEDGTPPLSFFENGRRITGESLYRGSIGDYEEKRRTDVMLVLDTSISMGTGTRMPDAIAAAKVLLQHAREDDRIGLATFGGTADVVLEPTDNHVRVERALDELELENRTTMFDAVSKSARAFDDDTTANRAIVLLSDGTDAGSAETQDEAIGEALKAHAPIYAIALREDPKDEPKDLAALGNGSSGEVRTVVDTSTLGPLFDELGRRILQPYWIEYRSSMPLRSEITVGVAVDSRDRSDVVAGRTFSGVPSAAASNGAGTAGLKQVAPADPVLPLPGGLLGVFLAALPFGLLVFAVSYGWMQRRSTPNVVQRIERYTALASTDPKDRPTARGPLLKRLAAPFLAVSESMFGRSAFFDRIRVRAEQAAIAVKPSEVFTAMVAVGVLGALFAAMVGGGVIGMLVIGPLSAMIPNLWLSYRARKRRKAFEDQLGDVLQAIASSLNAGHSFNQAINAMIKDTPAPTCDEFQRVMTEARLGMPIEEALQHMADRMGSSDFDFAVTTVNIQRTVGGSLAEILEMVGDTVRNRQQFRKKVKALTSMGQASAYVLLAMPFVIAGVISLMSPEYMTPLFSTTVGHFMLGAAAFSMTLGYVACMKIVNVKV